MVVYSASTNSFENNEKYVLSKEVNIGSTCTRVTQETEETFIPNNNKIVCVKKYTYEPGTSIFHKKPKTIETLNGQASKKEYYIYPTDIEAEQFDESFGIKSLKYLKKYSLPIQIKETIGSSSKYTQIKYNSIGLPKTIQTRLGNNGNFIEELNYN